MMVKERSEKVARVADMIPNIDVDGPAEGELLVIGWGGTYGHILSAVEEARSLGKNVSRAHFDYINPLPKNTEEVFSRFNKILVCELNSGQFASYLRSRFPQFNYIQCNKIQGQTFLIGDLTAAIDKALEEK